MSLPDEPPPSDGAPDADPNWQARTQILRDVRPPTSGGQDCLVIIYSRNPKGPLGRRVALDAATTEISIGRGGDNTVMLDSESVSRRHARLVRRGERWWVVDNNSTNGTLVNDQPVHEAPLRNGDQIKVGDVIFKYLSGDDLEAEFISTISEMMVTDGLTQAHNKRHLLEQMDNELTRSSRHGRPLSLIMFDIDHFKQVNDTYGHLAGDYILKEVSNLVRGRIRRNEVFGRYGGEEFAVLMPETDLQGAYTVAQEIRTLVAAHPFVFDNQRIAITISLGVAQWNTAVRNNDEFIRVADTRLYQAKREGRNRVVA